jgi:hypothetical protein
MHFTGPVAATTYVAPGVEVGSSVDMPCRAPDVSRTTTRPWRE